MIFTTTGAPPRTNRAGLVAAILLCWGLLWLAVLARPVHAATERAAMETSYTALADLLEDPRTRAQLVDQLRTLAAQPGSSEPTPPSTAPNDVTPTPPDRIAFSPSDSIASELQDFATGLKRDIAETWQVLQALFTAQPLPGAGTDQWKSALASLAVAFGSVLLAYFLLRRAAACAFGRLDRWTLRDNGERPRYMVLGKLGGLTLGRKLVAVIGALVIDIAATLLAALAAYVVIIWFTDRGVAVSLFAMQFLSAFVLVETVKAFSRGVFAVGYEQLRLLPVSTPTAHYWNRWLIVLITITGYSLMLVVPLFQALLTPGVGKLLGLVLMTVVYLYAITVVWQNRHQVSRTLVAHAERSTAPVFGTLMRVLARIWHWAAIVYFTALFVVSQADQQNALDFMARATLQSAIAILGGALLAASLSSLLLRHIALPAHWRRTLPLLEPRINAYVPVVLRFLRLLILVVVSLVVLDAWKAFDLAGWAGSAQGRALIGITVQVGFILLAAVLTWTVLASIIEHRLGTSAGKNKPTEREKTLLMLFRSAAAFIISTMTILVVLAQVGINIGPLIAGAGVAGLAIGFGAQKLVQDVITGIFIQLENGMNQNDIVEVAGLFGTVEKITIRSVVIRTLDGGYHLIPFSTIDKLTNHTRDYGYHYGEYNIGLRESVDEAIEQLELAFAELKQDPELAPAIMEDISIPGVTALNERGFTIRVLIKTTPGMQWAVQRGFNRLVKKYFDAAGIELPYPQTVVHFARNPLAAQAPPAGPAVR